MRKRSAQQVTLICVYLAYTNIQLIWGNFCTVSFSYWGRWSWGGGGAVVTTLVLNQIRILFKVNEEHGISIMQWDNYLFKSLMRPNYKKKLSSHAYANIAASYPDLCIPCLYQYTAHLGEFCTVSSSYWGIEGVDPVDQFCGRLFIHPKIYTAMFICLSSFLI